MNDKRPKCLDVKCYQAFSSVMFFFFIIKSTYSIAKCQHGISKWFGFHFVWMKGKKKWIWFQHDALCQWIQNQNIEIMGWDCLVRFSRLESDNRWFVEYTHVHVVQMSTSPSSTVFKDYISLDGKMVSISKTRLW